MKIRYLTGAAALGAVAALAYKDRTNVDEPVRAMFPVAFWGRRITTELGPLLRQYIIEDDESERPFNRTVRDWVKASARGKQNTIGFGTTYLVDRPGAIVFKPRTFTNEAATMAEQVGSTYQRLIGWRGTPPVMMPSWVFVSGMSYGALNPKAIGALNRGAAAVGAWRNTGEGGYSPGHRHGAGVIVQIGTALYGVRDQHGELDPARLVALAEDPAVKMFEVKLAQGAKPGKGGMLPGHKVTAEIAEIRGINPGEDSISPPRNPYIHDVASLFDFLDRVRQTTNKPCGIKTVIGDPAEIDSIAAAMAAQPGRGPDFITIDGGDGGTGAAPLVLAAHAGLPMRPALMVADATLRLHGVREEIALFASGRIATPQDAAVALALGADAVGVARANLLALGCIQSLRCNKNDCPTGIATQDPRRMAVLDADAAAVRVERYLTTLVSETELLARAVGHTSPDQLRPDDLMTLTEAGKWEPMPTPVTPG